MKGIEQIQQFCELKARGWSYARIADEINVSKPVLIKWGKQFENDIKRLEKIYFEELVNKMAGNRVAQLEFYAQERLKIKAILEKRDYESLSTEKLIDLMNKIERKIEKLCLDDEVVSMNNQRHRAGEETLYRMEEFRIVSNTSNQNNNNEDCLKNSELEKQYGHGMILINEKKFEEAINVFNEVILINPYYEEVLYQKAYANFALGNRAEALEGVNQCLKYSPYSTDALILKAIILILSENSENIEEALDCLDICAALDPGFISVDYTRILAYVSLQQREQVMKLRDELAHKLEKIGVNDTDFNNLNDEWMGKFLLSVNNATTKET